ncbi:tubulin polymerization-promoting protein family member 2 isoform X2 [Arvicola amphibius]|uniref:tubulin polymerization-promoting protein family member 2 isoform X2 n=1 Tax=Arvicola amphibius TaxID=1047088 RepID=UPI0018E2F29D|nr:tubulin polymerization-promoting protein family member 2 isoform X2 [Arvicola amphibius]
MIFPSPTVCPHHHLQSTMASEAERTFHRFAVFGDSSSSGTEINNKNFSKLCKDCGIMDGKAVTSTDVDIVFSKVKAKNARTINFQQFQEAMKELGQKRFKGKSVDEALEGVYKLMEGKDPATTGVTDLHQADRTWICSWLEGNTLPRAFQWYREAGCVELRKKGLARRVGTHPSPASLSPPGAPSHCRLEEAAAVVL